ncbi:hypothetical protein SRABI44_00602 [Microbacterium foliorum]|nr:hypothetical protein SRABI44_00602 [Microbacterium foliorum]CAH0147950.1 hypothetical protein SRABI03_00685 [Microbacterium foliorum]
MAARGEKVVSRGGAGFIGQLGWVPTVMLVSAALVLVSLAFPAVAEGHGPWIEGIRNVVLCVSLVGTATASYVAWPNRWNIPAHLQLAFSIPAYVVPVFGLDWLQLPSPGVSAMYFRLVALGFVAMTAGVLVGRLIASRFVRDRGRIAGIQRVLHDAEDRVRQRVLLVVTACVVILLVCFLVMGFTPALAADPNAAKFFKGVYHEPYQVVSIPYRLTTTVIPLLMPLVAVYAWKRRRSIYWIVLLAVSVGVMLLSLLREPAISGLLLALGILIAFYRRFRVLYAIVLVAAYVAGSAMYAVLALLGVKQYQSMVRSPESLLTGIASGAPDIKDQLAFLNAWLPGHELTLGRTFLGGLLPGNNPWNPSVWALQTLNPNTPIEDIRSGGLRLPPSVWGYVSFDWVGAATVPLVSGVILGAMSLIAARAVNGIGLEQAAMLMLVYVAAIDVFPVFYRLSYLSVLALIVVLLLLVPWRRARSRSRPAEQPAP